MPYSEYKPGYGRPDLTDEQVAAIDQILATETACAALPVIDPFSGVLPTVYPTGMNRRPWGEIRLEVFWGQDRFDKGPECANAIADQVSELLGYSVTVWYAVDGALFQGESADLREAKAAAGG